MQERSDGDSQNRVSYQKVRRGRRHISLHEKLASALTMLVPTLREQYIGQSADKVISAFDFDHNILHVHGGTDTWDNLTPMLRPDHREKTKADIKRITKARRIEKSPEKWRQLLAPKTDPKRPNRRWPKRKLRSKPINSRWRRKKFG